VSFVVIAGTFRKGEPLILPASGASTLDPSTTTLRADVTTTLPAGPVTEVKRTLLTHRDIDDQPGLESRIYLIEFPAAAAAKLHQHSTQGIGYVLEGSFESAFGDGPPTIKHAGEAFVDLANQPHHFKNADAARPLRFIVAGTFHKDEPLFQVL
jgi:quercetin dioxygenase-like cupin family protein